MPLLTADAPSLASIFGPPRWGIFAKTGAVILPVDSVARIEYARDYHISDFPQESDANAPSASAFASYNKVQVPYQAKFTFLLAQSRAMFLNVIEAVAASLELVSIVTPEISYASANITHYGYPREARSGRTLIRVDIWAQEVRILTGDPPNNAQSTSAATPTQSGQVQPEGQVAVGELTIGEPDQSPPLDPPT